MHIKKKGFFLLLCITLLSLTLTGCYDLGDATETDEDKAKKLEKKWRDALASINESAAEEGNGIECVIACGIKTGTKPYDIDEISKKADDYEGIFIKGLYDRIDQKT